ncbi:MAG TPA: transcriptional repressor [Tepidisphaeraceae bacterium]|jgi:Fur family ferric uptake transcriptional regulator
MPPRPDAVALLKSAALRKTPVRVGVLEALAGSVEPLGVLQLIEMMPGRADAVTVYRTLNTFVSKKLVHRVRGGDRSWRYAMGRARKPHGHPHFVCDACGKVECLASSVVPVDLSKSMHVSREYAVNYTEVLVHGVCPGCR